MGVSKCIDLGATERLLLDAFQRDFPLTSRPYADIAACLGIDEDTVLATLERLHRDGAISRIGAVVTPNRAGCSTLAAMAVPAHRLASVADLVSAYDEVNHNYEREHRLNLWFVATAADSDHLHAVLTEIEARTGLAVLDLPLVESYAIDLGFPLQWN